jgi:hypothetical protein
MPKGAIGSWQVTMSTPAGPQELRLHIETLSDSFTGRIESFMGNHDVAGSVTANTLSWQMKTTKPLPITVTFNVEIEGDTLNGTAKLGMFGKSTLTGHRLAGSDAKAAAADTPAQGLQVTGDSTDPRYNRPYVDVNELRNHPVPHRYVHGGFLGTDARFSFYFPAKDRYQGRFFHNTYPMALSEDIGPFPIAFEVSTGNLAFAVDSGAYYVQTNLGGADRAGGMADPAIAAFRVNAAAAKYSRTIAAEIYGDHRAYGYLFGGSGGSYQTIGSAENTRGVWDGFVPFVMACPNAIPSMFTVRMHALRVLRKRGKWPVVMDAINPGGSGDPNADLNDEERAALTEATLMGYPPRGWWNHATLSSGHFAQVAPLVPMLDPSYAQDFWSKPGYLGHDAPSLKSERFLFDTSVVEVIDGFPRQVRLATVPAKDIADAHLLMLTGKAENKSMPIAWANETLIGFAFAADQTAVNDIQVGDRVRIDNSWGLAIQTYHRHQVPDFDQYGWNQFRDARGEPIYPQRGMLIGPISAAGTAGAIPDGRINGKMLVLEALVDIDALPWQADWYRTKVKQALGSSFDENFALWFIDNAQHDNPQTPAARAHTVSYEGALQQALRDVSAWVEKGAKPSSTQYEVVNSQVLVPADAKARQGIQPVVVLKANGRDRAAVTIDEAVTFTATIDVPPGAGRVVSADWDFEGLGTYPISAPIDIPQSEVRLSATYSFSKPGTYFAVLRATSQREGDAQTLFGRIQNIARVRVQVT